jgi:hypothetical protein
LVSPGARRVPGLAAFSRFWADDRGLSVFSALLFVVVFVVPPLVTAGGGRRFTSDVVFALLLVSGVHALGGGRAARMVLMPAAIVTLVLDLGSWFVPVPPTLVLALGLVSQVLFLVVVLGLTLRDGPVTGHRLLGGVAAYLLLGVIWAYAYTLVGTISPGAFSGPIDVGDGPRALLYFSFVTLTTVGYGDVQPLHPVARSLAMLEAVTGVLYIAILISRLVSQALVRDGEATRP